MSGQNIIPLDPRRRARRAVMEDAPVAMLVFVIFETTMFVGLVSAFMLMRAVEGGAWPPPGQSWFPLEETTLNTAALLLSGTLVFQAARAWEKRGVRIGPLLVAAITLGAFFVFFQGVGLIRQGPALVSSHYGSFFCLIVGMHSANALAGLVLMGLAWLRLKPLRDDGEPRGSLGSGAFRAVRFFWYFVVGLWPVLFLCLYL